jgi:hypothetical protein
MKRHLMIFAMIASAGTAHSSIETFDKIKDKLKLKEGAYNLRSKNPACEEGYVDLELTGDDSNVTLRLGQKVAIVHLQKPSLHHEAEQGCSFDYTTTFGDSEINQVTKYDCPQNKSAGSVHTQKIQFAGSDLTYISKTQGNKPKQYTCKYTLVPGKKETR